MTGFCGSGSHIVMNIAGHFNAKNMFLFFDSVMHWFVNVGAEQERVKLDRCVLQPDHRCRDHLMRWRKLCRLKISHLLLLHTDWSFSGHYASAARIPPSRLPQMISLSDGSLTVVTV